jgi:hypothetical protein
MLPERSVGKTGAGNMNIFSEATNANLWMSNKYDSIAIEWNI